MPGRQNGVTEEALSRLPELDLHQLRETWCRLYKTATPLRLSRELLMRAVAYRIQELASGGLRPELQRQLHQIALELQQTGRVTICPRSQLKPGTRLLREWQGRSHEVLSLIRAFPGKPRITARCRRSRGRSPAPRGQARYFLG